MKNKIRFFCALLAVFALLTGAALAADNPEGTTVDNNTGTIDTNNGTVTDNHGTVTANNGTVTTNATGGTVFNYPGGTVGTNNGTVYDCGGTVTTNNGTVIRCGMADLSVLRTTTGAAITTGWTVSGGFRDGSGNLWVPESGDYAALTVTLPAGYKETGYLARSGTVNTVFSGSEVTIDRFVFNTVGDTAKIEIDVLAYPTLTPENAAVDLYRPADLVFTKKDGDADFESLSLTYDDSEGNSHDVLLTDGTDYQIEGDRVTVFASALKQLSPGKAYLFLYGSYYDVLLSDRSDASAWSELDVTDTTPERNVLASASPAAGGTVTADRQTAKAGETVTVTATPASGWKLKDILVDGSPITGNTFVMKDADAAVTAEFEQVTAAVTSPKTGDPGAAGWGLALLASGGALALPAVRKKRGR